MCLAGDVPLIESGTAGFIGQVQPIKKVPHYEALLKLRLSSAILSAYDPSPSRPRRT